MCCVWAKPPHWEQTLQLGRLIFKSFLLATVQNHGGRVVAQCQPAPAPQGQVQNTKRESQIQHGARGWDSISCGPAGAAPPPSKSHTHTQNP